MMTSLFHQMSTLGHDLQAFAPELLLCGTIVLLLLLRLFSRLDRLHMGYVALGLTLVALLVSWLQWVGDRSFDPRGQLPPGAELVGGAAAHGTSGQALNIFTGLLVFDNFTIFLKLFLIGFAALIIWLTLLTRIPDREDSADFYTLLLGSTLGMILMASSNHLLMIFIAVEMTSLPSYALAGFLKGKRQSSEAALKYVVYGGGAAGVMLYGMSILAGKFGTGYLPDVAAGVVAAQLDPMLVLGILFILIGFAFKLAAVPFHFWCPDVFEGASAEVAGFLSVASKGAALALLGRFSLVLGGLAGAQPDFAAWQEVARYLVPALGFFAALTATFGNLAAFPQTNLKRLLAYSTIAHAGYMMMGIATLTSEGAAAVLFYLVVYLFMNLGAFAVVAFIRNLIGSEDIKDMRGLVCRAPVLVISLAFCLLSLLGMPPLAGFAAKFQIFRVLYESSTLYTNSGMPGLGSLMIALLVIGGLNSVLSLVYYIKVLKVMIVDKPLEEVEDREPARLRVSLPTAVYAGLMGLSMLVLGVVWNPLSRGSYHGVNQFHDVPPQGVTVAQEKMP